MMNEQFLGVLVGLGVLVVIWILLREVVVWYFKINTMIDNQRTQNKMLDKQNDLLDEVCQHLSELSKIKRG